MPIHPEIKAYVDSLSYQNKDDIYRYLWSQHVREDVETHAEGLDIELTDEEIDKITELYVYEGEYDCELSYWDNIENLINRVHS